MDTNSIRDSVFLRAPSITEQLQRDREALIAALEGVCDYAERFCDAGEHLHQTRQARELLASIKASRIRWACANPQCSRAEPVQLPGTAMAFLCQTCGFITVP